MINLLQNNWKSLYVIILSDSKNVSPNTLMENSGQVQQFEPKCVL